MWHGSIVINAQPQLTTRLVAKHACGVAADAVYRGAAEAGISAHLGSQPREYVVVSPYLQMQCARTIIWTRNIDGSIAVLIAWVAGHAIEEAFRIQRLSTPCVDFLR